MRFVSRLQEAPGCFAAGRAFRGSGFRLRSRLRRLFASLTTPIPSPSFILFLLRSAIFSVNLYFPVAAGWPLEPPRLIGSTGFAATVADLLSAPSAAPPFAFGHLLCPQPRNCCATARNF